jgi:hypothetical protein
VVFFIDFLGKMSEYSYNIVVNWVDFALKLPRYLRKTDGFWPKIGQIWVFSCTFFFVQHMKILRAALNFTIIFEVTARKKHGENIKKPKIHRKISHFLLYIGMS